jgi:hypothetical protein
MIDVRVRVRESGPQQSPSGEFSGGSDFGINAPLIAARIECLGKVHSHWLIYQETDLLTLIYLNGDHAPVQVRASVQLRCSNSCGFN